MCEFLCLCDGGDNRILEAELKLFQNWSIVMSRLSKKIMMFCVFLLGLFYVPHDAHAGGSFCEEPFSGLVPDGKYDFSPVLFPGGWEKFASDWPRIFASGTPVKKNEKGEEEVMQFAQRSGRVIVVPPHHIITPFHVVDLLSYAVRRPTPFGIIEVEEKADGIRNESYWLQLAAGAPRIQLKKIIGFADIDTALFETADITVALTAFLPLGKSTELCLGHTLLVLGSPALLGTHIRAGIASAFHLIPQELAEHKRFAPLKFNVFISISIPIDIGDSGSPVVALRDGAPEIIGFASNALRISNLMHNLNMVVPVNEIIKNILQASGIDLQKLSEDYFHTKD
ncbi:MAG: serine protease [Candidatus Sungbacteria bacterium]|nr:serine protease [Candidatus Sungbacteria bacterium]